MTQEELEALSDDGINFLMQRFVNGKSIDFDFNSSENGKPCKFMDYCNDPAAIMPLAIENKIGVIWNMNRKIWTAAKNNYSKGIIQAENENPYRAIAIVYLLIQESKDE